jgi:hypothetical protein
MGTFCQTQLICFCTHNSEPNLKEKGHVGSKEENILETANKFSVLDPETDNEGKNFYLIVKNGLMDIGQDIPC